jgi:hypothetical protein
LDDFVRQNTFSIEADIDDSDSKGSREKGKKKKKKAKKQSSDFDLDMDNDDAMMQTRFSHIEPKAIATDQVIKGRRGAVIKKPGRLTGLSEVNEDEAGSDEDV